MVRDALAESLRDALAALGVSPVPAQVHLERPARREHGDWSSNVALAASKAAGRKPRDLAQELADHLTAAPPPHVESVEVAGPGFVNFRLRPTWLHDVLRDVVEQGTDTFARPDLGHGRKVNVEFVSANPTGPVHAGHARGATYGDALARLLVRCGHDVHREFYINDRGVQMDAFAQSLAARKAGGEPPENGYHGQYIIDWAVEMPDGVEPFAWGYQKALDDQREVLGRLGVEYDTWFS
ncbi:MAG TPA: arginine--tRNA ligase, partial [Acidimicrobiales bacterium]